MSLVRYADNFIVSGEPPKKPVFSKITGKIIAKGSKINIRKCF